jgi:hypothetical protein
MGGGMSTKPPTPVERAITTWRFLLCHAIALQHKITDEMAQHQKDQQIE